MRPAKKITLKISTLSDTEELGRSIVSSLDDSGPVLIALSGNLGAGKTTLVKSIAKALAVQEVVTSPTFTMMNEYHSGSRPLFHLDFYRAAEVMKSADQTGISLDFMALELEEILESEAPALIIMEWPEFFLVEGKEYIASIDHIYVKLHYLSEKNLLETSSEERLAILEFFGEVPTILSDKIGSYVL